MNINKVDNTSFNGYLDLYGYESKINRKGETKLRPCRRLINADTIYNIRTCGNNIVIDYKEKSINDFKEIYVPYKQDYKGVIKANKSEELAYLNVILNAYNAAKQNDNITIYIPQLNYYAWFKNK